MVYSCLNQMHELLATALFTSLSSVCIDHVQRYETQQCDLVYATLFLHIGMLNFVKPCSVRIRMYNYNSLVLVLTIRIFEQVSFNCS